MTIADEFRELAKEAIEWSLDSKTDDERKATVDLAMTWALAALQSEKRRLIISPDARLAL